MKGGVMDEIREVIQKSLNELNGEFSKLSRLRKTGHNVRKELDKLAWRCSSIAAGLPDHCDYHAIMTVFYGVTHLLHKHYGRVSEAPIPKAPKPKADLLELF